MQALADSGPRSLLTPVGYQTGSCGYCKDQTTRLRTEDSSASYYAYARELTVDHYQDLVDRGWRRSGTLLYKPDVRRQCCPHYTIRLPVTDFYPSKDQRQAINRWNKFVLGDAYIKEAAKLYPKSKEEKAQQRTSFSLVAAVHDAEYNRQRRPPEPAHRFEVTLDPDQFTEEKYALFENYQRHVHDEPPADISRKGFARFLCSSPLYLETRQVKGVEQKLGSFHQCYRLDGRLIAMGVLDILPHCVSGVYFIYHSDYEKWSFGKISALREAALALECEHQYYYMGFYIHSCMKMRYKGDYKTQYVLDLETGGWDPMDEEMKRLMLEKKYVSMSLERAARKVDQSQETAEEQLSIGAKDGSAERNNAVDKPLEIPDPLHAYQAYAAGLSLFNLSVPGVVPIDSLLEKVNIDELLLHLKGGRVTHMSNIISWENGSITDPNSLKGIVAELAACVGPTVATEMLVAMGPQ